MDVYYQEVRKLEGRFRGLELHHIPRKQNPHADTLAKMAAERKPAPNGVFINDLNAPSAREKQPAADKAKTEEAEHAQKQSTLPPIQPPTRYPGAQPVSLRGNPTRARQTPQIGESTYWLIFFRKSSPRTVTQPLG